MNYKKLVKISLVIMIVVLTVGCAKEVPEVKMKEKIVGVVNASNESIAETINYTGFVEPKEIKSYALKTSGRIENVNVEVGEQVEVGELLLALDDYEYGLGKAASGQQITLALLERDKAKEAKDFYEKSYKDTLVLFNEGAIPQQKLDEIKLQLDIKTKEVAQAEENISKARIDYNAKSTTVNDTSLVSDMDGYVISILKKEGEIISQGHPVVIVRSLDNVVKVGMSQEDIRNISVNDMAKIEINKKTYIGSVQKIDMMPDKKSRTYGVEFSIESGDFLIGETCEISVEIGLIEGVWLNINDVMNDGVDYVYIVKEGRATRRDIELKEINKNKVRVTNIEVGDPIIISGKKSLAEGSLVIIEGDANE